MEHYFAYGSNLNISQMRTRCPSAEIVCNAKLMNYQINFPRTHRNWPGGVASVTEKKQKYVEGVIYKITHEDLLKLDDIENVDGGEYYRVKKMLITSNGTDIESWVYLAHFMEGAPFHPSEKYILTIIEGAEAHGLSDKFIEELRSYI